MSAIRTNIINISSSTSRDSISRSSILPPRISFLSCLRDCSRVCARAAPAASMPLSGARQGATRRSCQRRVLSLWEVPRTRLSGAGSCPAASPLNPSHQLSQNPMTVAPGPCFESRPALSAPGIFSFLLSFPASFPVGEAMQFTLCSSRVQSSEKGCAWWAP